MRSAGARESRKLPQFSKKISINTFFAGRRQYFSCFAELLAEWRNFSILNDWNASTNIVILNIRKFN